ncbi:MAG: molybdopterin-dependent oxidoreductase [Rhizobiaceae bacterium]
MSDKSTINFARRQFLTAASIGASSIALAGCDAFDSLLTSDAAVRQSLEKANDLTYRVHRMLMGNGSLAQEFSESDIRQPMRPNGVTNPEDADYLELSNGKFASYRLEVAGLVDNPAQFSLADLRAMPQRTQITRHDCVEGWSCIAKWTGTPVAAVLDVVGVKDKARYLLIECYDTIEKSLSGAIKYYESIDLLDARHPQTILAWGMNGDHLPVANGAPIRMRVERQLGYKQAKYIRKITLVDDLIPFGQGKGGYWEDNGYDWHGGI